MSGYDFSVDRLDESKVKFVDAGGFRTRYYSDGSGDPMLLIHGGHFGFWTSLDEWSLNLPLLADTFNVYALDKLGQGHTDNPPTDEDWTFEVLFRHTCDFIDALGLENLHVVGHSRGALPAAWLALERPESVKTVTFIDSNTLAPAEEGFNVVAFYDRIDEQKPPEPDLYAVRLEPEKNSYSAAHVTDDYLQRRLAYARLPKSREAAEKIKTIGPRITYPSLEAARDEALERIQRDGLSMPTLVVWGYQDPSAPIRLGYRLFEKIVPRTQNAHFHVFNNAGHYPYREHPAQFSHLLKLFCQEF